MATSTNYGWSEPDNTSLVKDGAQAMRTLGDAIDNSLWNSGYGQAGKNKIINANFGIWQRGTSFNPAGVGFFMFADRWRSYTYAASATTASQQAFTPGTAPVAGYEGTFFGRVVSTNNGAFFSYNGIENVRTFAGQTVTLSYWAKSASAQTLIEVQVSQYFGSTGSAAVATILTAPSITTSWVRYTHTFTMPSITGKTISGGNDGIFINIKGAINNALDMWGFQLEVGSTATPFQTASGGSPQAELAMCQRYYWRSTSGALYGTLGVGIATSTTNANIQMKCPVTMRVTPTSIDYSTIGNLRLTEGVGGFTCSGTLLLSGESTAEIPFVAGVTSTGLTQYRTYFLSGNNSAAAFVGFSAEL